MILTSLLLILALALLALGTLRFDVLLARWRELVGPPTDTPGSVPPGTQAPPQGNGLRPHAAPAHKPAFHRSGRRH